MRALTTMHWFGIGTILALSTLATNAQCFEVEGFRDGMTKAEVKSFLEQKRLRVIWNENERVFGASNDVSQENIAFTFCAERLVQVTRTLSSQATLFNAIVLAEENLIRRGSPTKVTTGSHLLPAMAGGGQSRWLNFEWQAGQERTEVSVSALGKPIPISGSTPIVGTFSMPHTVKSG
jgi:hypothetical protein